MPLDTTSRHHASTLQRCIADVIPPHGSQLALRTATVGNLAVALYGTGVPPCCRRRIPAAPSFGGAAKDGVV